MESKKINYFNPKIYSNIDDKDCECIICTDKLNDEVLNYDIAILKCGHYFHKHCILKWFNRSKKCPICRDISNYNLLYELNEYDIIEDDSDTGFINILELIQEDVKRKRMQDVPFSKKIISFNTSYNQNNSNNVFDYLV